MPRAWYDFQMLLERLSAGHRTTVLQQQQQTHGNDKFGEGFVVQVTGKYVLDSGHGVDFTFHCFVESAKVRYPTDFVLFLGNVEGATYPRRATSG